MEDLKTMVNELNLLIQQLRYQEAFDKFYDENIVSHENENPPVIGLAAYREAGERFLPGITNYIATPLQVLISDDMSVTEWHFIFHHTLAGHWDCIQLSLQRWKNGKIVHERHHYNRPQPGSVS